MDGVEKQKLESGNTEENKNNKDNTITCNFIESNKSYTEEDIKRAFEYGAKCQEENGNDWDLETAQRQYLSSL